jgi:DUF2924 family protein
VLQKQIDDGPLVVKGEIVVDGGKFPALRRALERGRDLTAKQRDGWGQVAELRRTRQDAAADKLIKQLLGVKGDPMPDDVKAALRAKRAAMTEEEKRAEREERRTNRVLQRLAARAVGHSNGTETPKEDDMATKTAKKSVAKSVKVAKSKEPKSPRAAKAPKERDPRIPSPGNTIERKYKGKDLSVKVLEQGFEFEGKTYSSLTALALKITGAKAISGPRFFNLDAPKTEAAAK